MPRDEIVVIGRGGMKIIIFLKSSKKRRKNLIFTWILNSKKQDTLIRLISTVVFSRHVYSVNKIFFSFLSPVSLSGFQVCNINTNTTPWLLLGLIKTVHRADRISVSPLNPC